MLRIVAIAVFLLACTDAGAFTLLNKAEQGGLLIGKVAPAHKVYFQKQRIRTTNDGRFMIGLERDTPAEIIIVEEDAKRGSIRHKVAVRQRKWDIQRIDGLDPAKVEAPEFELERIRKEAGLVRAARDDTSLRHFRTCFEPPVRAQHRISGVFGSQRILNGTPKNMHGGLDYAAPEGRNVRATAAGRVVLAYDEMYFNGKIVIIDHGFGLSSSYLHLSRINVKTGELVKSGQKIGEIGTSGRSTGPHLHFEITWKGVKLDPASVLKNGVCK